MHEYVKHYEKSVWWSDEDDCFVSQLVEMPGVMAHGDTEAEALAELAEAADLVLAAMGEEGESLPEPLRTRAYSGRFNVRVAKEVHRALVLGAARAGTSLNVHVARILEGGAARGNAAG